MLTNIYIKNFILIDEMDIDLSNGLNVLSGETGSGKSIILDAISFAMTGKASPDVIRANETSAKVALSFSATEEIRQILLDQGIEDAGDEIIITRIISFDGKKKLLLNNQPTVQRLIDLIESKLIMAFSQHSFSGLFKVSSHIGFLDNFANLKSATTIIAEKTRALRSLDNQIEKLKLEREIAARDEEYLRHSVAELQKLNLQEDEESKLAEQRAFIQASFKQKELISSLLSAFENDGPATDISNMIKTVTRSKDSEMLEPFLLELEKAYDALQEAENILIDLQKSDDDTLSIDEIETRLFAIRALARKHNVPASNLLDHLNFLESKLNLINNSDEELSKLQLERQKLLSDYKIHAAKISETRMLSAKLLEKAVTSELKNLKMNNCDFKVIVEFDENQISEKGSDKVCFEARTNLGANYDTIDKIASGGEMARFMLALQVAIFSGLKDLPTIIFDEIDTGIGGAVADSVGDRLKELSKSAKLLIVTHQPQVAAKSDKHFKISKIAENNITTTKIEILSQNSKLEEIARMLSGSVLTEEAKAAARKLIPNFAS